MVPTPVERSLAETLTQQPYRLFFPLGLALSWLGVGHWLLFGLGLSDAYRSIFHTMAQIQGFLICFAMGFLFTMLPRRTESPPPGLALLAVTALCPIGTAFFAWQERWALAQGFWLVLMGCLLGFALTRLHGRRASRRPPVRFVWLPAAFAFGTGGALLTAVAGILGDRYWTWHEIGRGLVLQGMFLCLVLGVGGFAVPLMTRGDAARDAGGSAGDGRELLLHVLAILLLAGSFVVEDRVSVRAGLVLRALVLWSVFLPVAQPWRPPNRPGLNRWLIWLGAWSVPLGYTLASLVPVYYKGGLHVAFIGGFALMALAVSSQVILGHGGYEGLKTSRPWPLALMAIAIAGAVMARYMMEVQQERLLGWITVAAACFLGATLVWAIFLVPRLFRRPRPAEARGRDVAA